MGQPHTSISNYLSLGIANDSFNVHACGSGWSKENKGIGIYNSGKIFVLGEVSSPITLEVDSDGSWKPIFGKPVIFGSGDRIGMTADRTNGRVNIYINGKEIHNEEFEFQNSHSFYCIFSNNCKWRVSPSKNFSPKP